MPSSLPTTFSPGLFFLEALDYGGYSANCNLLEVFNLICTSSEFMNSAILPQCFMKRDFVLFMSDFQPKSIFPYEFCHSLRYVRELIVSFDKVEKTPDDEDSSNKKSHERIAQDQLNESHELATLVENSGLFGYYLRKLTVYIDKTKEDHALFLLRNSLCFVNKLETLVLEIPLSDPNPSQALIAATRALGKHLTTLELELRLDLSSQRSSKFLEPLRSCARLENLTIDVTSASGLEYDMLYDGLDFLWLTADCSLCNSLKRLKLFNMVHHVAQFRPFANLKKLTSFTLTQNVNDGVIWQLMRVRPMSERLTPDDFKAICVASSETLTELFLEDVEFESEHLVHLKELPHLRELSLQTVGGRVSLLHLRELPCFVFLKKLLLGVFASCDIPHSNSEILAHMLSQTKCLEYLCLWGIAGAQQHVNCIDWVHEDAPLLEVRLDAPVLVDVLDFPTMVCGSVTTLYLGFRQTFDGSVARLDSISAQMQQLPILFPNLKSLETGLLMEPFEQPFNCLESLSLLSTKTILGNALRRCFATNVFPKLRVLELTAEKNTSNLSVTDVVIWCRDLKKMKYLERFSCRGTNLTFTAESAEIAREYFPFIDYELSDDDEYDHEYWCYRDRREFFDEEYDADDAGCEDHSNDKNDKKSESEAPVGTRRQREDDDE